MTPARSGPGSQQARLTEYLDRLAHAVRHKDRQQPVKDSCTGLLLDVERKSIEPMAARLHPDRVQAARQSMHHLVAKAPWSNEDLLAEVRR